MGIWDVLKKKLANEEERHHKGLDEQSGKNVYEIASFDLNNASLADKIAYFLNNRSQGEQIQLADKLLREGPFEASIQMYQALIQKYPEERDRYENGIGSAYLKLGDYQKAIEYYITARSHGMHPDITDKHIWDACQKHHRVTGATYLLESYFHYCKDGKYTAHVKDLLKEAGVQLEEEREEVIAPLYTSPVQETRDEKAGEPAIPEPFVPFEEELPDTQYDAIFGEPLNDEDVAKKDKRSADNQFSLFGFGGTPEQEPASRKEPAEDYTEPAYNTPAEEETESVAFDFSATFSDDEDAPVEEAPNMLMALDYHVDQFFANEDVVVWRDKRNDDLRIDVYHIKPNAERDYHLLLTFGMSRFAMNVPQGAEQFKYGELAAILPQDWDLSPEGLKDPNNYWPVLWLKSLARIPRQHNSWLCYGHSIPHGDPAKPIANTEFEGVVIMDSATLPEDFQEMKLGEEALYIYTVIPVYPEEMEYKIKNGIDGLRDAFADAHIPDIIWVDRPTSVSEDML